MIWTDYSWWLLLFFTFVIHLFFDLKFAPQKSCIQNNSPKKIGAIGARSGRRRHALDDPWLPLDDPLPVASCHWNLDVDEIFQTRRWNFFFFRVSSVFLCFLLLVVNLLIPKNQLGPSNGGVWTALACCPDQPYGQFQHSDQTGPLWISYLTWSWGHPFKHSVAWNGRNQKICCQKANSLGAQNVPQRQSSAQL